MHALFRGRTLSFLICMVASLSSLYFKVIRGRLRNDRGRGTRRGTAWAGRELACVVQSVWWQAPADEIGQIPTRVNHMMYSTLLSCCDLGYASLCTYSSRNLWQPLPLRSLLDYSILYQHGSEAAQQEQFW